MLRVKDFADELTAIFFPLPPFLFLFPLTQIFSLARSISFSLPFLFSFFFLSPFDQPTYSHRHDLEARWIDGSIAGPVA